MICYVKQISQNVNIFVAISRKCEIIANKNTIDLNKNEKITSIKKVTTNKNSNRES